MMDGRWRKSSYSDGDRDYCVEGRTDGARVQVRDSKDLTKGQLTLDPSAWSAFIAGTVIPASI